VPKSSVVVKEKDNRGCERDDLAQSRKGAKVKHNIKEDYD